MSVESVKNRFVSSLSTIGRGVLSSLYPSEIECYITALELVDSQNKTADYLLFPLNPSSISESENQILNIKKTAGGISTTSTETFMPSVINLAGDFGRKFKILVGASFVDFAAYNFSEGHNLKRDNIFDQTIKTGYGVIKLLEKIIKKSNQLDQYGQPYFMYLYNLNFGRVYLVKCIGQPTFQSSLDKNMIWSYNIQFQTLAELSQIRDDGVNSNLKLFAFSQIQKTLNNVVGQISTTNVYH
jgi:hypothetical protein